ncbi:MAG: ABC transporter ATP-binding protein [Clostridia bacterium]|nr:ABC transporter ATP-binding protein [Clostridia bacterium]
MEEILQVNNLAVTFRVPNGNLQAVRSISFSLNEGETLAIVGESGSGKSVTSKSIMGILPNSAKIDSGEILYRGQDLLKLSEREMTKIRGRNISMIFQDPMSSLNPIMRIGKQITETILLNHKQGDKRKSYGEAKARAIELMKEVGISEPELRFRQYPFELSGGMRQRIVIAIALSSNPDLLICDEPTTALDVTIQAQILELINRLKSERKLTVLFITHDMGVVARMADRVAVMYAGKIIEYGTVEEIFYKATHPYTWSLLTSMPDPDGKERLEGIEGSPPDMTNPPIGDAFAPRNPYALKIDYEKQPPFFKVSDTHYCASWLLHKDAPKVNPPQAIKRRMNRIKRKELKVEQEKSKHGK